MNLESIKRVLGDARGEGRTALLETEGLEILEAMGVRIPSHLLVGDSGSVDSALLDTLPGERVVVKVVSPEILHKSDVGGVTFTDKTAEAVREAVSRMEGLFKEREVRGYLVSEMIDYDRSLGGELLVGTRWTEDFGPVVTFGTGGIYTEFLAGSFREGLDVAILSSRYSDEETVRPAIERVAVTDLVTGRLRGQKARVDIRKLTDLVTTFMEFAEIFVPGEVSEFEVNPFVLSSGNMIALDALLKLGDGTMTGAGMRPIRKIRQLLEPESMAVIGVSEKMNPGHIILNNCLREGFDPERIFIIKPGSDEIEGCRCFPDIQALPEKVDLFILSIAAAQVPEVIREICDREKAESVIVIPGGLEEKEGSEAIVAEMYGALDRTRESAWEGPVINGGNCLGIRSQPGRIDTMFIPEYKLPVPQGEISPVAFISQSGAFAVSKTNKLSGINPKYSLSIGNQMDLTIGDYVEYMKDDPEIDIFAVYVEGFKPLDGFKFLSAAREITRSGRTVILYRAGRTSAGAKASASHTASIAGDYAVTRELCRSAGIIVADSIEDFEDLTRLFAFLKEKEVRGTKLGALSNAGFECVAMADSLGSFTLPDFSGTTRSRLLEIFTECRIDSIVDIHNPIDLTPMVYDSAYEHVIRAVLDDENADIGIVGCVPLTPALNTLLPGEGHRDDIRDEKSIVQRMIRIKNEHPTAWVAVVDGGAIYDPMARELEANGVPTFRTADRALKLFNLFVSERLRTE